MKSIDPDGKVHEWDSYATWSDENGGTYTVSRPKDQNQDEPAREPSIRTSSIGWTGEGQFTVGELRSWLDRIPNNAKVVLWMEADAGEYSLHATWEVTP